MQAATWDKKSFSTSSNEVLTQAENYSDGADLIQLLQILNHIHPEYSSDLYLNASQSQPSDHSPLENLIVFLSQKKGLIKLPKLKSNEWADEVLSVVNIPTSPPVINGRVLLIAALLSQFSGIFKQLNWDLNWYQLCITLIEKLDHELMDTERIYYSSLLTNKGQQLRSQLLDAEKDRTEYAYNESCIDTTNLSDSPAKEDSLSRKALAKYLSKRLRHIYDRDINGGGYGSFFMHIDGAWGSGKSTLLGFLEDQLQTRVTLDNKNKVEKKSEDKWIIVNFNAWENQRLDPPWWFLMKTVYHETFKKLWKKGSVKTIWHDRKKCISLFINEHLWRFTVGSNYLLPVIITLVLFILSLSLKAFSEDDFKALPIIKIGTLIGFLWSLAKLFGSSLVSGSAKAARTFVEENSSDPMQALARHFIKQVNRIGYPVAIFIDDLDRCNKEYGIKLLEGLQTIFKKANVVYVIAADRKWVSTMYEDQYSIFAQAIAKPAKPFGWVFLDKIFQLIVELPDISSAQKKIYWDKLLDISEAKENGNTGADINEIKKQIHAAANNTEKMKFINTNLVTPENKQMVREEIVGSLEIGEEEKKLEHRLQNYIDLIEPNPRAMKRLINDVSTARAISFLYGQDVDEDQLILWSILKLQHPLIADYFWINPEKINEVLSYDDPNKTFTANKEYDQILARPETKKLFQYLIQDKIIILDIEFLKKLKFQVIDKSKSLIQKSDTSNWRKPLEITES